MSRVKNFDSTGVAPSGRLFAGDLNSIQDHYADLFSLTQAVGVSTIAIGEAGLQLVRYGVGEARLSGAFRTDGIIRALGGIYAGAFTTTDRNAIALPPYGLVITNTTTNQLEWNAGTPTTPNWLPVAQTPKTGTLALRPATGLSAGMLYYATDQDVAYFYNGSAWVRVPGSAQAGDIVMSLNAAAATGRILLQGQAWPATIGIYADLFALWGGSNLPDLRGRVPVDVGTHTDVSAIKNSDGLAVASRRPKHGTSIVDTGHAHVEQVDTDAASGTGIAGSSRIGTRATDISTASATTGITAGPQSAAPIDAPAYFVVQFEAHL